MNTYKSKTVVPFFKPSITDAEVDEVVDTLRSGWLTTGPKTKRFEKKFANYIGQSTAIAVNSCTAALHLSLEAIGVQRDDRVVVPTMTFAATGEVVRYFGAKPLLVDCRPDDYNLDVDDAERRIGQAVARGERVVAIIPVHYGGQVCDVKGIQRLAAKYSLRIVEDAAHCCPAYYRDDAASPWKSVGSDGDISCYSFYANKTITTGEGGMACTSNPELADRMRVMSLHGISRDAWNRFSSEGSWYYEIVAPGFKYNMTDVASALGIHQLRRADEFRNQRRQWAACYTEQLEEVDEIVLPTEQPNRKHSWHLYEIRLRFDHLTIERAEVIKQLRERNITTSVHWMPLHMHPYYRETYGYAPEDYPVAASVYPGQITLPLFPGMTEEQVQHVAASLKSILASNRLS
ncbi:DegT/DnrJ/EryC1/StrS family aminotransferase [Verrucomicrobia bacterium]|nr:DegT/DnrJ/EryC1/StrS family aminotransferase [Verrucomicrobiota bacterium]